MNCLQKRKKHYWLRILVPNKSWLGKNIWVIHRKKKDIDNKKIKKKKRRRNTIIQKYFEFRDFTKFQIRVYNKSKSSIDLL